MALHRTCRPRENEIQRLLYLVFSPASVGAVAPEDRTEFRSRLNRCPPEYRRWEWNHFHLRQDLSLRQLSGHGQAATLRGREPGPHHPGLRVRRSDRPTVEDRGRGVSSHLARTRGQRECGRIPARRPPGLCRRHHGSGVGCGHAPDRVHLPRDIEVECCAWPPARTAPGSRPEARRMNSACGILEPGTWCSTRARPISIQVDHGRGLQSGWKTPGRGRMRARMAMGRVDRRARALHPRRCEPARNSHGSGVQPGRRVPRGRNQREPGGDPLGYGIRKTARPDSRSPGRDHCTGVRCLGRGARFRRRVRAWSGSGMRTRTGCARSSRVTVKPSPPSCSQPTDNRWSPVPRMELCASGT